jgi:ATP-binding cassette, subfamily B, bacterial
MSYKKKRSNTKSVFELYRRLKNHTRPFRLRLALAGLCLVGATAAELLGPWPLKMIFDGLLMPTHRDRPGVAWVTTLFPDSSALLVAMVIAIMLLAVLKGLFGFGQTYLLSYVGQRVVNSIRVALYSHIQRLSMSFHDERSTGDVMTRLTQDVNMMRELMVNSVLMMLARTLVVTGSLGVMFWMDWRLALVGLLIVPLLALTNWHYSSRIKGAARQRRSKESRIAQVMTENMAAIKVVQAYAREAYEEDRVAETAMHGANLDTKAAKIEAHMERLVQIILAFGTCIVVGYGVLRVQAGYLTPGDLLVFMTYLGGLYRPIRKFASTAGKFAKAAVCAERIVDILDLEPEISDRPDAIDIGIVRGRVDFQQVSFAYISGAPVLQDASFHVRPGEVVAFMSESGTGKSTIANLLMRFYDPHQGSVLIDGQDIRGVTLSSLRREVTIMLQESILFNTTIMENIAYGWPDAPEGEVVRAAKAASAYDFIMNMPDGFETMVGERGASLSGGQRQRISIARAILRNSPILILDEPLTGLDRDNEDAVLAALHNLMQGRTTIIITHDGRTAALASRVLTIRKGRVLEVAGQTHLREVAR